MSSWIIAELKKQAIEECGIPDTPQDLAAMLELFALYDSFDLKEDWFSPLIGIYEKNIDLSDAKFDK